MNTIVNSKTIKDCAKFIGTEPLKIQTVNAQEIYNNFQYFVKNEMVIFDFRSRDAFQDCHIKNSINIPLESCTPYDFINFNESKFAQSFCQDKLSSFLFKGRRRSLVILIPSENSSCDLISNIPKLFESSKSDENSSIEFSEDEASLRNALLFKRQLISEKCRNCFLSKSGMRSISESYPCICEFKDKDHIDSSNFPSEILKGCLYLGSANDASNELAIKTLGITHILNVTDVIPNYFENNEKLNIKYENIFIEDTEDAPIHNYFRRAFDFIDNALFKNENNSAVNSNEDDTYEAFCPNDFSFGDTATHVLKLDLVNSTINLWHEDDTKKLAYDADTEVNRLRKIHTQNKVLVHCAMGKSRSATIITMYLMKKFLLPYKIARNIVKVRREKIEINYGFINILKSFEENDFKYLTETTDEDSESTEGEETIVC